MGGLYFKMFKCNFPWKFRFPCNLESFAGLVHDSAKLTFPEFGGHVTMITQMLIRREFVTGPVYIVSISLADNLIN